MNATIVITGASSGIGLEAASTLARMGNNVVLTGRNAARLESARAHIAAESPEVNVTAHRADFSSLIQVRALARELLEAYPRIDVLINNAGGVSDIYRETEDGFEQTFATNHLASFLLTELLTDRVVASAPSRIVFTSSFGHRTAQLDFDDLNMKNGYHLGKAYGRSKLAMILYSRWLDRHLPDSVTSVSLHPGAVGTDIWSGAPPWLRPLATGLAKVAMMSPQQGSEALVFAATDPSVTSGAYYTHKRSGTKEVEAAPQADDAAAGDRLVAVSRDMVGLESLDS